MPADGIRLIVGLGNPGTQYAKTRHNVGAWLVNELASHNNIILKQNKKLFGRTEKVLISSIPIHLFIPDTYMNESGKAVLAVSQYYKLSPSQILIAHDELDFPTGTCKLKSGGGHGGHNGLRDIKARLGRQDFHRLRIGISHPGNKNKVTQHVLNSPTKDEEIEIHQSINSGLSVLDLLALGQFEQAFLKLHSED